MIITRREVSGTGWPLRTNEDLMSALTELSSQGWTGAIQFESGEWKLRLSADGKNTVNTKLGEWLILDGDLRAISCGDFDELYTSDHVEFPMQMSSAKEEVVDDVPFGSQTSPNVAMRMTGGGP